MAFNASNIPVESQEANQPVLIERFELIRDSAGAGRFRGGTGIRRDLRFFLEGGKLTNNTERHRFGPWGLFGGQPGQPGVTLVNPGTPAERRVHSKASDTVEHGDVVSFQQSGAGGYGPPWERDPQARAPRRPRGLRVDRGRAAGLRRRHRPRDHDRRRSGDGGRPGRHAPTRPGPHRHPPGAAMVTRL